MKKNSSGKKQLGKPDGVSDNDSRNVDVVNSELEARLQRLENAHSNGSTDVYKFIFFFLMGVGLTLLIYPRISSTIDTRTPSPDIVTTKSEANGYNIEQIDDLDVEQNGRPSEQNRGKSFQETRSYKRSNISENDLGTFEKQINKSGKQFATADSKDVEESVRSNEPGQNGGIIHDKDIKSNPDQSEEVKVIEERVEDLMIEEYDDGISQSIPLTFSAEDQAGDSGIKIENDEPTRVELFSANVEDIPKDNPKVGKANNAGSKPASKKSSKSDKTNRKSKSEKTEKKKTGKKAVATKGNDEVPKEIRDFKATYQKDLNPKKVFIDGRRIPPMELLPQKPNNSSVKVWLFEEFLSDEECDGLMRVHNQHVKEQSKEDPILCFDSITTLRKHLKNVKKHVNVTPMDFIPGTTCVNASFSVQLKQWLNSNWSYSTAFYPGESRFASVYEQRVKQAMGLNPENGGKFQITSYPLGIGYKAHTDCTEGSDDKRDRMATVLVYLDTVEEGGETEFTELGIWARPRKGRALLWNSMNPAGDCELMSIHKANKVNKGHKYILQRWYYYKSFYSLGKRPPEPPLPERRPGQARVSCDEYEHGSCRWYDEWNFEHMIEYERQKYTLI